MGIRDDMAALAAARAVLADAGDVVLGDTHGAVLGTDGNPRNGAMAWSHTRVVLVYYGADEGDYISIQSSDLDRLRKPAFAPNATIKTLPESFTRGFNGIAELVAPKDRMKSMAADLGL